MARNRSARTAARDEAGEGSASRRLPEEEGEERPIWVGLAGGEGRGAARVAMIGARARGIWGQREVTWLSTKPRSGCTCRRSPPDHRVRGGARGGGALERETVNGRRHSRWSRATAPPARRALLKLWQLRPAGTEMPMHDESSGSLIGGGPPIRWWKKTVVRRRTGLIDESGAGCGGVVGRF